MPSIGHPGAEIIRSRALCTIRSFGTFQEIARRLGADRERQYLRRLEYGNQDASGGLTTFWLGRTLAISPDEQSVSC
jgi:hypothetical protein